MEAVQAFCAEPWMFWALKAQNRGCATAQPSNQPESPKADFVRLRMGPQNCSSSRHLSRFHRALRALLTGHMSLFLSFCPHSSACYAVASSLVSGIPGA